mmetsp:Transcript_53818/g.151622  ORF Transcript_53818/g.151622 Transcript_53818/m.151622 type:complete len:214 (-) Transcript_53818:763-1404(-)
MICCLPFSGFASRTTRQAVDHAEIRVLPHHALEDVSVDVALSVVVAQCDADRCTLRAATEQSLTDLECNCDSAAAGNYRRTLAARQVQRSRGSRHLDRASGLQGCQVGRHLSGWVDLNHQLKDPLLVRVEAAHGSIFPHKVIAIRAFLDNSYVPHVTNVSVPGRGCNVSRPEGHPYALAVQRGDGLEAPPARVGGLQAGGPNLLPFRLPPQGR